MVGKRYSIEIEHGGVAPLENIICRVREVVTIVINAQLCSPESSQGWGVTLSSCHSDERGTNMKPIKNYLTRVELASTVVVFEFGVL